MTRKRRILLIAVALIGVPVAAIIAFALWLWWPSANKLTRYAASGDVPGIRLCVRFGVEPNTPSRWGWSLENDGQMPLTAAAQHGRVDAVRVLLQSGADPNLRDAGPEFPQNTPLATAAMHGDWAIQAKQSAVAELLRQHGARESGARGSGR